MKKRNCIAAAVLSGAMLLGGCDWNKPEPIKPVEPTIEQKIADYAEKVCVPNHIDRHSAAAMKMMEENPFGISFPAVGLGANKQRIAAEKYEGSDLHTHLTDFFHVDCIGKYADTLETSYTVEGEISHDPENNNKVKSLALPNITLKDGLYAEYREYTSFSTAVPSEQNYTTTFTIVRELLDW